MLLKENSKLRHNIFILELEIKEKQAKLKMLKQQLEDNNQVINSTDDNSLAECIKCLNKEEAKLFIEIEKLPKEKRMNWSREGKFKCNLCLQIFREGFNNLDDHIKFFKENPNLVHLSKFYQKHTYHSICYQNRTCSYCEENNAVKQPIFNFRTQRDRHLKKHKKENIEVPINRVKGTREEIIDWLKINRNIKTVLNSFSGEKLTSSPKTIPLSVLTSYEDMEQSSTESSGEVTAKEEEHLSSPEPVVKKIIKRKKLKIVSPTPTLDYDTDYSITTMESDNESPNNEIKNNDIFTPLSISRPIYNI